MPIVNAGKTLVATRLKGTSANAIDTTNGYIGVGDSTTNATPLTYTDLQASTNKLRKQASSVGGTSPDIVVEATFGTSDANFAWNEWGVFNAGPTGGTMLCRKVESLGTKTNTQTWVVTATLTIT